MSLSSKKLLPSLPFLLSLLLSLSLPIPTNSPDLPIGSSNLSIGITYSRNSTSDLPQPDQIISTLLSLGVAHVRILDPDPDVVSAFSYRGISLILSIPNTYIHAIAANQIEAIQWLYHHVLPFYLEANITTISVGNDVLTSSPELSTSLLPAMQNVYLALHKLRIRKISVSTTVSFDIITNPFPPSAAEFQKPTAEWIMKPILEFISTKRCPFLINAYRSLDALFQQHPFNYRDDPTTGVRYRNLFDEMVDAVISAMAAAGHKDIPLVVTETGWPTDGDLNEPEANEEFGKAYVVWPRDATAEVRHIFEMFDDGTKQGPGSDRHWGILNRNMTIDEVPDSFLRFSQTPCGPFGVVGFCLMFVFLV